MSSLFEQLSNKDDDKKTSSPTVTSSSFFNGTARGYIFLSMLITIILTTIVVTVGPQHFVIDKIKLKFCDPNDCSQHRTPYIFAFGLMTTYFITAIIYIIFSACKYTLSKYILPFQIITQVGLTIGATYIDDVVYKIGYWMFFSTLKFYFLQSVLLIQTIQYIYTILIRGDRYKALLGLNIIASISYLGFSGINAAWFFGRQCDNNYDILYVCVVTVNILAIAASILDSTYGFFLPLLLATVSQIYLFITLHSSTRALECGKSILKDKPALEWINMSLLLLLWIIPSIKIIHYFTSQRSINELFFNESLRHVNISNNNNSSGYYQPVMSMNGLERQETLLFDSGLKRQDRTDGAKFISQWDHQTGHDTGLGNHYYYNNIQNDSTSQTAGSFSIPSSSFTTNKHQRQFITKPSHAPRHYEFTPTITVDDVDNDVFVEHYFYNEEKHCWNGCAPAVTVYLIATYIFSLFVFTTTHFGEHVEFKSIGVNSNHIQWFYIMNMAWVYALYTWYLLAMNRCPRKNLV